ncbi:DUF885 domain-containing protein [Reichenbachiella ulvae]|uniref:DUF885 domain-containing protein n=1 Tax=Reichenbachiella ulvae TaxID=2980104 RepID=A0ABT3CVV1_9BACT|nr:DUF885 domain-containing protein [Reichenbachiella ulvae]MCV9387813.1 DUF885 domain-containing protein [Reichenbachiella ulvae]
MKKLFLGFASILFLAIACEPTKEPIDHNAKLEAFFEKTFEQRIQRSPEFQTRLGRKTNQDKWDDYSAAFEKEGLEITKKNLKWIQDSIDYSLLSKDNKVSYDLFVSQAENKIADFKYRLYSYPVNQMFGLHSSVPSFLINMHRIDSIADAKNYLARVEALPALFDQLIVNLKEREDKGIVPPKFVFGRVIDDCKNIISGQPLTEEGTNSIYEDLASKVDALDISDKEKEGLKADMTEALQAKAKPAYESLIVFLTEQEGRATTDHGAWKFPEGEAFYQNALNRTTTTSLTSDEIHEIGLKEVARIHGEMKDIMKQVGFEGELKDFFTFLKEDEQFYYPNTDEAKEEYLDSAKSIINNMKSRLDELFLTKPKADMIVRRVESFREKSAGKAFYQRPAKDGSRPGIYYANLYNSKNMPKFEMEALAYHEGIPGHHMQMSIAQELEGIPEFRKFSRYTAYSEGWGLYCEQIPKEMGLYADPYSDYGRLAMELWRACRLVVDTGIHGKKWTREEGIAYYQNNTSGSERECVRMLERHIVMPSQATAYKIGMMKILELRTKALEQLGDKFDIREYHDVVLTNGLVPLDLLEKLVDEWVASKSAA